MSASDVEDVFPHASIAGAWTLALAEMGQSMFDERALP